MTISKLAGGPGPPFFVSGLSIPDLICRIVTEILIDPHQFMGCFQSGLKFPTISTQHMAEDKMHVCMFNMNITAMIFFPSN